MNTKRYDLLFYDELKKDDREREGKSGCLFFYYKNKLFNTSLFQSSTSADFDEMFKLSEEKYIYIKYFDDDTVSVGEGR